MAHCPFPVSYTTSFQKELYPTCFHLPDIYSAIRAADDHEIVQWSPLDGLYREQVPARQHDTLLLPQAQ